MSRFQSERSVISKILITASLIALNCFALLALINIAIWGYYKISDSFANENKFEKAPMRYKKSNEALEKLFPQLSRSDIDQLIHDCRRIIQEYDTYTQFKEAPYKTRFVNVDVNGFRHSRNQGPWPPNKNDFVIFFFGGSTSFGYGVPDNETVASHLQEILTRKLGLPVRIYNFGRATYFSSQERILFEKLLLDGHVPNMAFFMDGINEFIIFDGEPGYTKQFKKFMQESDIPLSRRILNELPVYKLINGLYKPMDSKVSQGLPKDGGNSNLSGPELLRNVIQRYHTNKRIIEAISRDYGITSVFVWQPMPLYGYDVSHHIFRDFDYDSFSPHLKGGYEFVSAIPDYRNLGQNFIWLADMQRNANQTLYVSAFHYSPAMSKTVASSIAEAVITRNLVPAHSTITPGVVSMSGSEQPTVSEAQTRN